MASRDGAFAGAWQDDEGTVVVVKDSRMYGPDGGQLDLKISGRSKCSFQMGTEIYEGTLSADGKLVWNDGAVWVRVEGDHAKPCTAEEHMAMSAKPQTNGRAIPNGTNGQSHGIDQARKAFEEEKARKAAALDRARAARAAAAAPAEKTAPAPEAKDANEAGIDRAKKAFEEEKARKAAALDRARAARRKRSGH
ncbi:unnamed protein product [Effrenium voratum]|nr:unnamed protein product [Effrenium voratum]